MATSVEKLAEAVNELNRLVEKGGNLRRLEMLRALDGTCAAITALLADSSVAQTLQGHHPVKRSDLSDLLDNLKQFKGQFISVESKALRSAGFDDQSRKMLLRQATYFRTKEAKGAAHDEAFALAEMRSARDLICSLAAALREPDEDGARKREVRQQIRKVLLISAGVATVTVNAAIALADPGVAAISALFGNDMFARGRAA